MIAGSWLLPQKLKQLHYLGRLYQNRQVNYKKIMASITVIFSDGHVARAGSTSDPPNYTLRPGDKCGVRSPGSGQYRIGQFTGGPGLSGAASTASVRFDDTGAIEEVDMFNSSFSLSPSKKQLRSNRDRRMFYTSTSLSKNHRNITPRVNFSQATSFNHTQN
jgi:hypothetical protein